MVTSPHVAKWPQGVRTRDDRYAFLSCLNYLWILHDRHDGEWADALRERWDNPDAWPHDSYARTLRALDPRWIASLDLARDTTRPVLRRAKSPF
jgi:hypothetical protein